MAKLYHREIYLPQLSSGLFGNYNLAFTQHALRACLNDRYGTIKPPRKITLTRDNLIEVEIEEGRVVKVLARITYNETKDILIAFMPEMGIGQGVVKTVWLNEREDKHNTLKREIYAMA